MRIVSRKKNWNVIYKEHVLHATMTVFIHERNGKNVASEILQLVAYLWRQLR